FALPCSLLLSSLSHPPLPSSPTRRSSDLRHLSGIHLRLGDVLVDPVDEGLGVVDDLLPFARLHPADDDRVGMVSGETVDLLLQLDRKSTRLNSSHEWISYAVFCLKKKI